MTSNTAAMTNSEVKASSNKNALSGDWLTRRATKAKKIVRPTFRFMLHARITSAPPQLLGPALHGTTLAHSRKRTRNGDPFFCGFIVTLSPHFEPLPHLPKGVFETVGLRVLLQPKGE
jgi:hypothetical protein